MRDDNGPAEQAKDEGRVFLPKLDNSLQGH